VALENNCIRGFPYSADKYGIVTMWNYINCWENRKVWSLSSWTSVNKSMFKGRKLAFEVSCRTLGRLPPRWLLGAYENSFIGIRELFWSQDIGISPRLLKKWLFYKFLTWPQLSFLVTHTERERRRCKSLL
jgi:hypothetical protein